MTYLKRILAVGSLMAVSQLSHAVPMIYTFEGIVDGFQSYHSDYTISDFDINIGQTSLKYVFEVDFDADNSTYSNSAGTWNYFYTDLLDGSIVTGGNVYGDRHGFNWDTISGANIGQITSSFADVRITASENFTTDWLVQNWSVGQSFRSVDSACYSGGMGGCAVYAFGDVTLTSIVTAQVDEPASLVLMALGLGFLLARKRASDQLSVKTLI